MSKKVQQVWKYCKGNKWLMGYMTVLLLVLPLTILLAGQQQQRESHAAAIPLAIDVQTGKNQSTSSSTISSPAITTKSANELVVVFLSNDGSATGRQQFTSVTGGGLNFTLARRANSQPGTAEVWYAYSPNLLNNVAITATKGSGKYQGMISVVTFTGARSVLGASNVASGATGASLVGLTTTVANSWIWAVGNDWSNSVNHIVGPNQTMVQQFLNQTTGDTYWVQRQLTMIPGVGTLVNMNDTAPTSDKWNMVAVEVLPAEDNTTPIPTATTYTLWPSTTVPGQVLVADAKAVEVGVKFKADVDGKILGIRYYKGSQNTGVHVGNLWTETGQLIATATFGNETDSGWQQVLFAQPVSITANTVYVASYHTNVGQYSGDNNYFVTNGVDNGPLHALATGSVTGGNGVYNYGDTSVFPTNTYQASNYWVDVLFQTTGTQTVSPTTAVSPTQGSSSPTPILTNTPTPTPSTITGSCAPYPSFPDATCTGVPAGQSLTSASGMSITTDGTVIDAKDITGSIDVYANNVTIKNTRITASGDSSWGIFVRSGAQNTLIQDVTIKGFNTGSGEMQYAIRDDGTGTKVYRANMYNCADCVQSDSMELYDSYIHDMGYVSGDHTDTIQSNGGSNTHGLWVIHNRLENSYGQTGVVSLFQDFGVPHDAIIKNNYLAGGGYTIYGGAGSKGTSSNIKITDNVFSKKFYQTGGYYGYLAYWDANGSGNVFSGNVWEGTNQPVGQ